MHLITGLLCSPRRSRRPFRWSPTAELFDRLESRVLLTAVNLADEEQLILELINRARANPEAEAARLGISLNAGLPTGTISATPKQPLAPNTQLQSASVAHSVDMINRDFFAHTNPSGITSGERATAAGYSWWTIAENIAYIGYFGSVDINANSRQAHDLLFRSAGHRENILMEEIEEIGVGIRNGAFAPSGGNATLVTENFGRRILNPIITGVVYSDTNNSDFYDIGEAVRSGTITARRLSDGATFTEDIGTSGGYGLIVPAGNYLVTASFIRNGVPVSMSSSVTVATSNLKVDFDATVAVVVEIALASPTVTLKETGSASTVQFTVTRTGSTAGALTVNLNSSDTSEISVPASVVIPVGESSVSFTVTALNDGLIDGAQNAAVQASADGAVSVSRTLRVNEGTAPAFSAPSVTTTVSRPTFTWSSISNAATYEIQIQEAVTGSPVFIQQAGLVSPSFQMPTDLPIGDYYVLVRGVTSTGQNSVWSTRQYCRSRPMTLIERRVRTETTASFTIRWATIPGAVQYDVLVDRLTSQTSGFYRNTTVPTTSLEVSNFPIGRYQIRVRGQAANGIFSAWSTFAVVTVSLQPTGVRVSAPEFGALTTLHWDAVDGADHYDIRVDNKTTGVVEFIHNPNVIDTSLEMPTLSPGYYSAYVKAIDSSGRAHTASASFLFLVNGPTRLFSATSVAGRPALSWRTIAGADRYELVFLNTSSGSRITLSNLTGIQYQPESPLAAGSWRAWIRAFDSQGHMTSISNVLTIVVSSSGTDQSLLPSLNSIDAVFCDAVNLLSPLVENDPAGLLDEVRNTPPDLAASPDFQIENVANVVNVDHFCCKEFSPTGESQRQRNM